MMTLKYPKNWTFFFLPFEAIKVAHFKPWRLHPLGGSYLIIWKLELLMSFQELSPFTRADNPHSIRLISNL